MSNFFLDARKYRIAASKPYFSKMERWCCLCREALPLDRRRKKCLHGDKCETVKVIIVGLLSVPLEEVDALNAPTATICSNCEKKANNINHYQSKVETLKKNIMEMLSSQISFTSSSSDEEGFQAKRPCLDSGTTQAGDDIGASTSTCSPTVTKYCYSIELYNLIFACVFLGIDSLQGWYQNFQYWYSIT